MKPAAKVEAEAADWLAKRDSGRWSKSDQAALDAWSGASTGNRIALLRLEAVWNKADRLRASAHACEEDSDPDPDDVGVEAAEPSGRRWFWPAAAAAAIALVAAPATMLLDPGEVYSTQVGGFQRLPLADGSRVDLNTDSELDVDFSPEERRVALNRGEAYFKVAKDHARPFVVVAGDYRVTAVGTAFSVRLNGRDVDVVVTEGRVRIDGPELTAAVPMLASAGQVVDATEGAAVVRPAPVEELEQSLGWRDGLLIFDNRPLGEVAAEFNRYNRHQLLVDPSATDVVVDGTFRATNLEGFLRLLHQGFGVQSVPAAKDKVILSRG